MISRNAVAVLVLASTALSVAVAETTTTQSAGVDEENARRICRENLSKIDGSKEQFALEHKVPIRSEITWQNLLDPGNTGLLGRGYLRREPVCPSGGKYTINVIGSDPKCSLAKSKGHVLAGSSAEVHETTSTAPAAAGQSQ
jgi:hypothetical protein